MLKHMFKGLLTTDFWNKIYLKEFNHNSLSFTQILNLKTVMSVLRNLFWILRA